MSDHKKTEAHKKETKKDETKIGDDKVQKPEKMDEKKDEDKKEEDPKKDTKITIDGAKAKVELESKKELEASVQKVDPDKDISEATAKLDTSDIPAIDAGALDGQAPIALPEDNGSKLNTTSPSTCSTRDDLKTKVIDGSSGKLVSLFILMFLFLIVHTIYDRAQIYIRNSMSLTNQISVVHLLGKISFSMHHDISDQRKFR